MLQNFSHMEQFDTWTEMQLQNNAISFRALPVPLYLQYVSVHKISINKSQHHSPF